MTVRIVTDSTADLPKEIAESLGISVVPTYVQFGTESLRDGVDIGTEEFYRRLTEGKTHPTTSATPPGDFIQTYQGLAQETDEIISIHLTKELSAVYNNALQAKNEVEKEGKCKIEVINSGLIVMAMGLLVISAAKLALTKKTWEEIIVSVKENISQIHFLGVLDTLKYIEKGGRVEKTVLQIIKRATSILKVKPVLTLKNGEVAFGGTVRPHRKKEKLVEFIKNYPYFKEIALEYSPDVEGKAEKIIKEIKEEIRSLFPDTPLYLSQISPVLGTHAGPGALVVSLITE